MSLRIGFVYDLRKDYLAAGYSEEQSAEFDSEETIDALEKVMRVLGYAVIRIGNARALCSRLAAGERWDLVFNIAEGVKGRSREAQVPCLLELYDIPYTFADPLVAAVTMDKAVAKKLVQADGLNTPAFCTVTCEADVEACKLQLPLFAKPIAEGTGKGIDQHSRIESRDQLATVCRGLLERFRQPVLVEEYLPGREFTVGILGTGREARAIGTMEVEILATGGEKIYSFETKEKCEILVRYARLEEEGLKKAVEDLALNAFRSLECRDGGRVDIRLDAGGKPAFMEVNVLPGLHPTHSDLPMIAAQEGMSYVELIGGVITSALRRTGRG